MITYIPQKNDVVQIYSKRLQKYVALGKVIKSERYGDENWSLTVELWLTNEKKEFTTFSYNFYVIEQK